MRRAPHRLRLVTLFAVATLAAAGCTGSGCGPSGECANDTRWELLDERDLRVERWHSRLEYRIVLTITAEGASSEARDELRTASQLAFTVSPPDGAGRGYVRVDRVGFSGVDGSDLVYESYTYVGQHIAYLESAMGGCGEGECTREFLAWAEIAGEGLMDVRSNLTVLSPNCGESGAWLRYEVERVADLPDASTAPPDGGTRP